MRILIAANHYPVASGRYMLDAFRRLGHEVKTAGDAHGTLVWGMTVDPKYVWTPDSAIMEVDSEWPDLVVVMDTDHNVWNQVEVWKGFNAHAMKAPVVIYTVDNHVRDVENALFDHYFLAHYHGPCYPVDPTRKDHTWLPCATDSKLFTPSPIAWADREYDVCMIGVIYPRRAEVVSALRDAGFKVRAETGLLYDEYRNAYHNARISLCVSAAGDVAQRIFETGGMGCAILTDPLLDFADEMTNKALHLYGRATYTNPKEAVNLTRELVGYEPQVFQMLNIGVPIESGALGEQTAREMQKNCFPHTWEARAQVVVNWFETKYGKVEAVADMTLKRDEVKVATEADLEAMHNPQVKVIGIGEPIGVVTENGKVERVEVLMPFMPGVPDEEKQGYIDAAKELIKDTYAEPKPERKPFLNLGCGRVILPGERPAHHQSIPENIYQDEKWVNIDRVGTVGADKVFDLFAYPWPLESDSYNGAILTHVAEHIPHEIKTRIIPPYDWNGAFDWGKRVTELEGLQDGFFAFFSELTRVLTPGAEVHLISPHGMCTDAFIDPTHTRQLFPHTFQYFIPNLDAPFEYGVGSQWQIAAQNYGWSEHAHRIMQNPMLTTEQREADLKLAMDTQWNMIREFYVRLKVVK